MRYRRDYQETHDIDWFFRYKGKVYHAASNGGMLPDKVDSLKNRMLQEKIEEMQGVYKVEMTENSASQGEDMSSFSDYAKKGFISLESGARVGVGATAVYDCNELVSVKNVNSLNIRSPRDVKHCADGVLNFLYVNSFPSIIVAGKPNSGKTTLLRDIARGLSSGFNGVYRKIAVIDERFELGGNSSSALDLGVNTDILSGYSKAEGIETAERTLSPEMIICDELATMREVEAVKFAFRAGISFALSVHCDSKNELAEKLIIKALLETGEFSYFVLLDGYSYQPEIIETSEVLYEINRYSGFDTVNNGNGLSFMRKG